MYQFTPEFHHPKNKKAFKKADIWPADVVVATETKTQEYWVMTPDARFIPFSGYDSGYFDTGKKKEQSDV